MTFGKQVAHVFLSFKMNRPFRGQLLLVGEGDFSLSVSLLSSLPRNLWGNITSTSFESDVTILKHKSATDNIQLLRQHGRYSLLQPSSLTPSILLCLGFKNVQNTMIALVHHCFIRVQYMPVVFCTNQFHLQVSTFS